MNDASLVRSIRLPAGGTLLVLGLNAADGYQTVILLLRHGEAREVLRHEIDYGEGNFALRDADGRIAVDFTGDAQLGERHVTSETKCTDKEWPGSTLVYDESVHGFVVERMICLPRQ
jgi:hypothetical protein